MPTVRNILVDARQRMMSLPGDRSTAALEADLLLAHVLGAPELLGGFAAGLALSRRFFLPFGIALARQECFGPGIADRISPIVGLFTPVFFVVVGLNLNLQAVDWSSPFIWSFSLSLFALAAVTKMAGALLMRGCAAVRWSVGLAMIPRGEVGLIFAELGRTAGVFSNDVYAGLILVIAMTTLLAPLILSTFYRRFDHRGDVGDGCGPAGIETNGDADGDRMN